MTQISTSTRSFIAHSFVAQHPINDSSGQSCDKQDSETDSGTTQRRRNDSSHDGH
jgi:hypothetical protein